MEKETITVPKRKYEEMLEELKRLRDEKEGQDNLLDQVKESLEDVKAGRIRRVA